MSLRIHALFHTDYADLSFIKQWARAHNHPITVSRSYDNDNLPTLDSFDWLIVMGGPMSVHDEDKYSWLIKEKRLIKQAVDAGKTVIGICLGAQIIAHCLGAEVKPSAVKEIGWLPMQLTEAGQAHPILQDLPKDFTVFHWHGEGFDCPKGASIIAKTQAWPNQGFIYQTPKHKQRGTWVLAWQCHFEATKESLPKMVSNGNAAIQSGLKDYPETVQAPDEILVLGDKYIEENNARLATMFNRIAASANK